MTATIFSDEYKHLLVFLGPSRQILNSVLPAGLSNGSLIYANTDTSLHGFALMLPLTPGPWESTGTDSSGSLSFLGMAPHNSLQGLDTRLYTSLGSAKSNVDILSGLVDPLYLVWVSMTPQPTHEAEAEFNAWYDKEHLDLLSKVPGWLACRRFMFAGPNTTEDAHSPAGRPTPPKYLALHAWRDLEGFSSPEFEAATNTPWRTAVIGAIIARERFVFRYDTPGSE